MDSKEKQRLVSLISDYNAHKRTGGRLYEISVETDTKREFICKGVLRLYWDIQRPIVLDRKATSSFVQKRERTSNIVGRPSTRRRRGSSTSANDASKDSDDLSPVPSRSEFGSRGANGHEDLASKESKVGDGALSPEDDTSTVPSATNSPIRQRSSTCLAELDVSFGHERSSSVSSPVRCVSLSGRLRTDLNSANGITVLSRRPKRSKSSSTSVSPTRAAADSTSTESLSKDHPPLHPSASHELQPTKNISRYFTGSFRRSRSPRPIATTAIPTSTMKTCASTSQLESSSAAFPNGRGDSMSPENPNKMDSHKPSKRRGPSFRKSSTRHPSPKRQPSLVEVDSQANPDASGPGKAASDPSEKSGSLFNFLQRPRISFKKMRAGSSHQSSNATQQDIVSPTEPVKEVVDGPESLAEFYQPPKGSVTNIRATSSMTSLDVIGATLGKLSAVDEPSRFAIFSVDDRGTVKLVQDDEQMLFYRIRLGPKEDVVKLFIMERDTNDAQDFSTEVMQYYHLGMPFLERLVQAYEAEEEREIERIHLKYADTRQRLERRLRAAEKAEMPSQSAV